jgi:hypothetical protein
MLARGSMMARLGLLVGMSLVTMGNLAFCSFNSGPGGGTGLPGEPDGPGDNDSFRSTLVLRNVSGVETSSFVFGEAIRFDFTVENRTARQLRLSFPDAQTTDYLVVNQGTTQIRWTWSEGQSFVQVTTELVFEPYSTKSFSMTWNGNLSNGTNLPPGDYQARGLMVFDGYETNPLAPSELAAPLVPFTVR